MTTRDDLIAARKLIERPESWCQGAFARLPSGNSVFATNPKASCFCAYGATVRVCDKLSNHASLALARLCDGGLVDLFNDTHTHSEVLDLFDRAIAACGE